jgi:hypothetical protein
MNRLEFVCNDPHRTHRGDGAPKGVDKRLLRRDIGRVESRLGVTV